jgi:predicted transcriptional regulator
MEKTTQKTAQKIIALVKMRPEIIRKELAEEIGITEDGIKYNFKKMQERGIIKKLNLKLKPILM